MAFTNPAENLKRLGLGEGAMVADFGTGAGYYALEAARRVGDTGTVYAIDIQRELLAKVKTEAQRERLEHVEVLWGDIDEPRGAQLPDESVNVVILSNVLFQLEDKATALAEAYRVLKAPGRLLLIDWSDSFAGLGPQPDAVVSPDEARRLAQEAGFDHGERFDAGDHHYGFIFRKQKV